MVQPYGKTTPVLGAHHNFFTELFGNIAPGATDKAKMAADAAIKDLKAGKPIWTKPVKDNKGKVVLPDAPYDNYADALNGMTYLVEGVMGSTT